MEDSIPAVTVRVVVLEIFLEVAAMVAVPAATAVARPLLLMVATAVLDDLQVTRVVILWVVPSENEPEAVNCFLLPTGTLGLAGVIDMHNAPPLSYLPSFLVARPMPFKISGEGVNALFAVLKFS